MLQAKMIFERISDEWGNHSGDEENDGETSIFLWDAQGGGVQQKVDP